MVFCFKPWIVFKVYIVNKNELLIAWEGLTYSKIRLLPPLIVTIFIKFLILTQKFTQGRKTVTDAKIFYTMKFLSKKWAANWNAAVDLSNQTDVQLQHVILVSG